MHDVLRGCKASGEARSRSARRPVEPKRGWLAAFLLFWRLWALPADDPAGANGFAPPVPEHHALSWCASRRSRRHGRARHPLDASSTPVR
ncbi:hypothetical protein KF707C_41620 [Metapseudomonas furukawaii]|uniref:Uncharacterized protein n=1 Tax=Metapseudomonas furukawaii TaxID=1149133 RepID=A0AAD1FGI7_METFU|nr:hypothetical protein KF707C_41620 [Pseudomonas furukawaii]